MTSAVAKLLTRDAGCDSAGEPRLLLPAGKAACRVETRYPVLASNKWYFIDVAIPEHRIGTNSTVEVRLRH